MRTLLSMAITLLAVLPASAAELSTRVLVFGDSNSWGARPSATSPGQRHPVELTWPYRLDASLPDTVDIIVEGLGGRTTGYDPAPDAPIRWSGTEVLPTVLASHMPLDLLVIMLGTNDLLAHYDRSIEDIEAGVRGLIQTAQAAHQVGTTYPAPEILLVAPPLLGANAAHPPLAEYFSGGHDKSLQFASVYARIAGEMDVGFFDAASVVDVDTEDGIHFDAADHEALAAALEPLILNMLAQP